MADYRNVFRNKVAVVTGGASGIGRALGERLAGAGAAVVLADKNGSLAAEVAEAIAAAGGTAQAATVDVTRADAVKALVDETAQRYGRLDYMFNNAGIAVIGEARDATLDDWQAIVDVNIRGVIHGVVAAYPLMIRQGSGHIVNTASLAGLIPAPGFVAYSMSKHAVVGLSTSLRAEAEAHGVRVSAVCPGFIDTPIVDNARYVNVDRERLIDNVPVKFYSADACARDILRGVADNEPIVVVTGHAKMLSRVWRYAPRFIHWYAERQSRKSSSFRSS